MKVGSDFLASISSRTQKEKENIIHWFKSRNLEKAQEMAIDGINMVLAWY